MNTEKEQKVLNYLNKTQGRLKLKYDPNYNTPEGIRSLLETKGYSKESAEKEIKEFNLVVSNISIDDLSEKTRKELLKTRAKLGTLRRLFVKNENDISDLPKDKYFLWYNTYNRTLRFMDTITKSLSILKTLKAQLKTI